MPIVVLLFVLIPVAYFCIRSFGQYRLANSPLSFLQFGDRLSSHDFFFTLTASSSGLATVLYLVTVYGYFYGFAILPWVIAFWLSTMVASVWTIKQARKRATETELYSHEFWERHGTLHEFLGAIFASTSVRRVAATMTALCYLLLIAAEAILSYQIVYSSLTAPAGADVASVPFEPLAAVTVLVVLAVVILYTAASGFRAVIKTDEVQFTLIVLLLIAVWIVIVPRLNGIWDQYSQVYGTSGLASVLNPTGQSPLTFFVFFVLANFVFWIAWWPTAMDQWHRCAATGSHKSPISGIWGTCGAVTVLYVLILSTTFCSIGVVTRVLISPDASDTAPLASFLHALRPGGDLTSAHPVVATLLLGFIVCGMMAAVTSTLDTYLVIVAQSFVSDIKAAKHKIASLWALNAASEPDKRRYVAYCRLTIVVCSVPVALLVGLIATITSDTFVWVYIAFSFTMTFVPIVLIALIAPRWMLNSSVAATAIVMGAVIAVGMDIFIITRIESFLNSEDLDAMLVWYNYLYMAPIVAATATTVVYGIGLVTAMISKRWLT